MSNYSALKTDINNNIYENNTQQITGTVLNTVLKDMVNTLGAGYQFAGCAYLDLNPGAPDAKVFYLAGEGLYPNFDNIQVPAGKLGILKWDTRWRLETIEGLGGGGANLTGYISLPSVSDLPEEGQPTIGYLIGENLYLYVGEGGDTADGKYQNCGGFRGPEGVSITDIEQVVESVENGGRNTIRITLSDGHSYDVYVRNGKASQGLFPDAATLNAQRPNPSVGEYAFVGSGFPADIYVCNTAGTWTDSGADYDGDSVDLTDYATKAEVNQLEHKVDDFATGKYYGTFTSSSLLPEGTIPGFAYIGSENPFEVWVFNGTSWSDSGATMDGTDIPSLNPFKGLYNSLALLETAYPNPQLGDYAYVKNSGTPATANIYNVVGGEWTDTNIVMNITDMESVFPLFAKLQLIATLEKVAWVDANAQTYLSDLRTALLGNIELVSISATFTPGTAVILDTMSLDNLKQYLTVTATFSDGTVENVTGYQLSGLMTAGTNTITVTYLDETDTFTVTVLHNYAGALSNWYLHPNNSVAEYTNGMIRTKCSNSTDQSNYSVWVADCKTAMWSAVNGKTVKIRVRSNSKASTIIGLGVGVYASASITSLGSSSVKRKDVSQSNWTLADDGFYEYTLTCNISNFTIGSLTPTSSSTFGIYAYARSLTDYAEIYEVQVYEVTP